MEPRKSDHKNLGKTKTKSGFNKRRNLCKIDSEVFSYLTTMKPSKFNAIFDTGATHHMLFEDRYFINYKKTSSTVSVADGNSKTEIKGKGTAVIPNGLGGTSTIYNALHVPGLVCNLISLNALERSHDGGNLVHGIGELTWKLGEKKIFSFKSDGYAYCISNNSSPKHPQGFSIKAKVDDALLQSRHFTSNISAVKRAQNKNSISGIPSRSKDSTYSEEYTRDPAILANMRHGPISKRANHLANEPLAWTHVDIIRPKRSFRGYTSILLITDEFSRRTELVLLKTEANLHTLIENYWKFWQHRLRNKPCTPLGLRADNQFKTKALIDICAQRGVQFTTTIPHNSWQNGIAERANLSFTSKMRKALQRSNLPTNNWCLIAKAICYIHNRSPHSALNDHVPEFI